MTAERRRVKRGERVGDRPARNHRLVCAAASIAAALLASLLATPQRATASVAIGPEEIVVEAGRASAVIARAPFNLSFRNSAGDVVLAEVPNQPAFALPPGDARLAGEPAGPALYAPLSFLVGRSQPATFTEYLDSGDLRSVEESGTEYSATEVLAAEARGEGVALTVSTDDPAGRTLSVDVAPQGPGAIKVSATPSEPAGVGAMADSFVSSPSEAFHGFGGEHNSLDQHGQSLYDWVDQENVGTGASEERDLVPDGPHAAYYAQASFVSNRDYGFLLDGSALSTWRLDDEEPQAWQTETASPALEYVVAPGSMTHAISTLTAITGRQRVPPAWLGPMFDQEVEFGMTAPEYEKRTEYDLEKIVSTKLPVSAFRVEGWVYLNPAFRERLYAELKANGIRPLVYFRPFAGDEDSGETSKALYEFALAHHLFATQQSGEPFLFTSNYGHPAGLIDFTNPAAVAWWRERVFDALEEGAEGFMLDFGEQVQPGMHFMDGTSAEVMHNLYPVPYDHITRTVVDEFEASHPGRQIIFFTRAGFSGEPGSAAYESFNFPGDETTDWTQSSGLASLTRDMLNRAIGGAYGYSTDIGGYYDAGRPLTTRELFLRWAEWAALSPVFRLHGAAFGEHAPWSSHIHALVLYKQLTNLHISAEPLIASLWQEADETGIPVTRPLYLDYPDDPQAAAQDQEWLLGANVLVAPVVEQEATSRSVYLPDGCWRDPETGLQVTGPRTEQVAATVSQLPFFFRCGTAPFKPPGRFGKMLRGAPGPGSGAR
jgi:alpha-glucosidase (family GH31 glycosyl hydrolase)